MKKLFLMLGIAAISNFAICQDEVKNIVADANAEVRKVGDFHGIDVSNAISVYLSQGSENAVAVSCEDASQNDRITTAVKNGILIIRLENGSWNGWSWKEKRIRAYITVKDIDYIQSSGACSIKLTEAFKVSKLKIDINGASTFKGSVTASEIVLDASGASSVTIEGTTKTLKVDASGASSIKAYDLQSDDCDAEASGASSIGINAQNKLKAEASGASSIRYKGEPKNKDCNASGASSVKARTT
jgi:hypothetical protein